MHYKNGREAKAGDKVVLIDNYGNTLVGILHSPQAQSDTCNGRLAPISANDPCINIKDCLHVDDIAKAIVPDSSHDAKTALN